MVQQSARNVLGAITAPVTSWIKKTCQQFHMGKYLNMNSKNIFNKKSATRQINLET